MGQGRGAEVKSEGRRKMFRKTCPECDRCSYSAAASGPWDCPYCGEDLSEVEAESAE